jgi:hypothetical protein
MLRPCRALLPAFGLLLFLQPRLGATTTYDFESFSDSDILTNQLPGLTFTNTIILTAGISLNEFEFPPHSGVNVVSDNGGPISVLFSSPVLNFSGYFTYSTLLTMTAFDAGSNQVGQVLSLFNSNLALSGDHGSSPNELLQVTFAGGISGITIAGDPAGGSFTLDDAATTSVVSELGTVSLALSGAIVLLGLSARANRSRKHL